ncbi:MAG: hypothetical protein IT320_07905 [Anaerolineae bacterium]|nr:hypothetical protein [Anaerolineae bacterium]
MGTYSSLLQPKPVPKDKPVEPPQASSSAPESERNSERTVIRSEVRTDERTMEMLPVRRRTRRYSFEFYDDQIFALKKLKRAAEDRGEQLTLSDMARAAFDLYLQSKRQQ